jgi:hypothetical protein
VASSGAMLLTPVMNKEIQKYRMTTSETHGKQEVKDRVSLKDLLLEIRKWRRYFTSRWKTLLLALIVGGVLGAAYSLFKKTVYTATCTFVLDNISSGGQLGQYAGLASMVGVNVGGSSNGIFQNDNIIELYLSKKMVQKTLLTPINPSTDNELLIDRYIDFNKLREKWRDNLQLKNIHFNLTGTKRFSRVQDSLLRDICTDIKKKYLSVTNFNDNVNMIKVEVKAGDEVFAKSFNDNIVKNVNDFYIQTKTKTSFQNVRILQHQTDSVRNALNGAINTSAIIADATQNLNPTRQVLRVPAQRSQINAEANKAILTELVKNLELAKISFRKETPLLEVIDTPVYPLEENKINIIKAFVVGALLMTILVACILFVRKQLQEILS